MYTCIINSNKFILIFLLDNYKLLFYNACKFTKIGSGIMSKELIKTEIIVKETSIRVIRVGNVDYISLTDLAKFKDKKRFDYIIQNWLRSKHTLEYIGTWELLYNQNFNSIEFDGFKMKLVHILL